MPTPVTARARKRQGQRPLTRCATPSNRSTPSNPSTPILSERGSSSAASASPVEDDTPTRSLPSDDQVKAVEPNESLGPATAPLPVPSVNKRMISSSSLPATDTLHSRLPAPAAPLADTHLNRQTRKPLKEQRTPPLGRRWERSRSRRPTEDKIQEAKKLQKRQHRIRRAKIAIAEHIARKNSKTPDGCCGVWLRQPCSPRCEIQACRNARYDPTRRGL